MSLLETIKSCLTDPRLKEVDYDSDELLKIHRQILLEKTIMQRVFAEFYDTCMRLDQKYFDAVGKRVEIGAGVSFFKNMFPEVISTDIKRAENLDMVVDALDMPFDKSSVRSIYAINCFHHLPNPERFFCELDRGRRQEAGAPSSSLIMDPLQSGSTNAYSPRKPLMPRKRNGIVTTETR